MELYEKLIHLRKQKGLSQLKLAEELGVSRQAISKWEVGTAVPSTENLRSLSKLYGVSLDYLVEDKNIESSVENDIAENEPSSDTISNEDKSEITQDRMRSISGKSVYGKLSFKVTSLGSIMSGKCWLKGTVTGSEDKIDVSWRM